MAIMVAVAMVAVEGEATLEVILAAEAGEGEFHYTTFVGSGFVFPCSLSVY